MTDHIDQIKVIENILNKKKTNNTLENSNEINIDSMNLIKKNASNTSKTKLKNKCPECKKKFKGLMRFKCKCGIEFCSTCRYPEVHKCDSIVFKCKDDLISKMPVIAPKKIDNI